MITIKKDNALFYLEDWNDLLARPQFCTPLDDKQYTLKEIIGRYHEPVKRHCGLKSCNTPHNRGYIVETAEGPVTNIGKDCGANYFSVDFENMAVSFNRALEDQQRRLALWELNSRCEAIISEIETFRRMDYGADWVHQWVETLCKDNSTGASEARKFLRRIAREGNPAIFIERAATEAEREINKEQFVRQGYGSLDGIEVLYPENDLRKLLIIDLTQGLREFEGVAIDNLERRLLHTWAIWVGAVDSKLETAKAAHAAGVRFLAIDNLKKLAQILEDKERTEYLAIVDAIRRSSGKRH